VTSLREVDIVCLERVALGQKSFDMVFVFHDYTRDVVRIEVIPMTDLDKIKDWLNDCSLKYYESKLNLNWRKVLKTMMNDHESETNDRWEFLNPDAGDSDSESSETEDDQYEPSDMETGSESDDEGSDDESVVNSADDDGSSDEQCKSQMNSARLAYYVLFPLTKYYSFYQPSTIHPTSRTGPKMTVVSHGMRWSARQGMLTQRWAVSRTARMRGSGGGRKQRPSLAILVSHRPRVPRRRGSD